MTEKYVVIFDDGSQSIENFAEAIDLAIRGVANAARKYGIASTDVITSVNDNRDKFVFTYNKGERLGEHCIVVEKLPTYHYTLHRFVSHSLSEEHEEILYANKKEDVVNHVTTYVADTFVEQEGYMEICAHDVIKKGEFQGQGWTLDYLDGSAEFLIIQNNWGHLK